MITESPDPSEPSPDPFDSLLQQHSFVLFLSKVLPRDSNRPRDSNYQILFSKKSKEPTP